MKTERMSIFRDFVGELTVNYRRTKTPKTIIKSPGNANEFIRPYFDEFMDDHEEFKIIHLSKANVVVNIDHLSKGGDAGTMVPISNAVRNALYIKTSAVIMVHNHPSGNLKPSEADKDITKKLQDAFKTVEIQLLDSMILTREGYFSFADTGLIE